MVWSLRIPWLHWPRFGGLFRLTGRRPVAVPQETGWRRDPLAHPALRAMSQRDLGDLPFDPRAVVEE